MSDKMIHWITNIWDSIAQTLRFLSNSNIRNTSPNAGKLLQMFRQSTAAFNSEKVIHHVSMAVFWLVFLRIKLEMNLPGHSGSYRTEISTILINIHLTIVYYKQSADLSTVTHLFRMV